MRRGGRESTPIGIALVCLDISAAVIIVTWDLVQGLSEKVCAATRSGVRQLWAARPRLRSVRAALVRGIHIHSFRLHGAQATKPRE
jgi:hypothetical protein